MDRKLKLLCFHPALAPYRVDFFNLLAKQVDLKLVLMLKNLRTQGFDQEKLRAQLDIPVEYTRRISLKGRDIPYGCIRRVKEFGANIVFTYECSPVTLLMIFARKILKMKFFLWSFLDDSPDLIKERRGVRRYLRDWVLRNIDGAIVPSDIAKDAYSSCTKLRKGLQFAVLPIIHDVRKARSDEKNVFLSAEKWRDANLKLGEVAAMFVGRLTKVKNLEWLADRLEDTRWPQKVRLFVVGDGELRGRLEGRMTLLGRHEGPQLDMFFAAADMLILPSSSETFGAVVSESLQWGAPALVSSRVGARSLLIDEFSGRTFEFGDSDSFYENMKVILNTMHSWIKCRPSIEPISLSAAVDSLVEMMQ